MTTSLSISAASAEDYPAFVRLFLELAVPEAPPALDRFVDTVLPGALMAREGDAVVGYAWSRARGEQLHVVHLVTAPEARGRGVGRALMNAVAERGRAAGFRSWMLNVKPENVAARALYTRCGMSPDFEAASVRIAWADVERLAPSPPVQARILATIDDAAFEDAFGLSRGELEGFRSALHRIVFGVDSAAGPVGVAAFDPPFPGASPFRLRSPQAARALLEALRPHSLPQHDGLSVFVENDAPLEAALTAAGGAVALRVLRMQGAIPSV